MYYNYRIERRANEGPAAILFTSATRKKGHPASPGRVVLGLPSPSPRVCTDGRTDGWTTLTSEPNFFGSTGYQICLPMVLHELRYYRAKFGAFTPKCTIFSPYMAGLQNKRPNPSPKGTLCLPLLYLDGVHS